MINHLDNLLRHLLMSEVTGLVPSPPAPVIEDQIGFQPPDDAWRTHVSNLQRNALNVYLLDLRENRKLRSNERVRSIENGIVNEEPAPRRLDCHYLITAWSPATVTPALEPTLDEHPSLYEVTGVLMNNEPLVPLRVYDPDPLPVGFPAAISEAELPTTILPVEGFPKLAEFWGTVEWRWKPGIYLIVTLPVVLDTQVAGPMVTTRITEYRQTGRLETVEVFIQIGGTVTDAGGNPVGGAWVRLETPADDPLQTTYTDERSASEGRFTFLKLAAGDYQMRVRASGFTEEVRDITVPSSTGEYDVTLT